MKEYRQNSHSVSLVFWAILCSAAASVLFIHSHRIISRALRIEEILGGIALLIFGPAALAVYLIRARRVWVTVHDERGIVLSGRRTIAWEEILGVVRRPPLLRKSSGPAQIPSFETGNVMSGIGSGCGDVGCFTGLSEFFVGALLVVAALFALWVVFFVFIPLVILPALEVFVPFGDRIKIVTRRGTLVLRDLSDADDFMARVGRRPRLAR
jgi:hypothetical protein